MLAACEIPIRDTYVVYINNQYVRKGQLDIQRLFTIERVTKQTTSMQNDICDTLPGVFNLLGMDKEYSRDIGLQCSDTYDSQFATYCWSHKPEKIGF